MKSGSVGPPSLRRASPLLIQPLFTHPDNSRLCCHRASLLATISHFFPPKLSCSYSVPSPVIPTVPLVDMEPDKELWSRQEVWMLQRSEAVGPQGLTLTEV